MKKKIRKLLKKNFLEAKNAFSLVEIAISLLVISIIIAALTPTISKRLSATSSIKNRISTNCDGLYPDGYCAMCYITPKKCITCTRTCESFEYKNVSNCACEKCTERYNDPQCSRCDSKACRQCNPGYYLDENSKCIICPKGHRCYQTADGGSKNELCPKGTAAPREGMSACESCKQSTTTQQGSVATSEGTVNCTLCGNGTYASQAGQAVACKTCPAGYYCPGGKYLPCPKGTANGRTGQTVCTKCLQSTTTQQGSVAVNTAMTACTLCGNGQYAASAGQGTACASCPTGRYCPTGKLIPCAPGTANNAYGQTVCPKCLQSTSSVSGTYAPNSGMTVCTVSSNGRYTPGAGATTTQPCPAGYRCPNGMLIKCAAGTIATGGASTCTNCGAGTTSAAGASSCVACATGCSACYSTAGNCTSCKPGYYKSGSSCIKCPAGKYCQGGTSGAVNCPPRTTSQAGASSCVGCAAGCSACSGTANNCTSCDAGKYKNGTTCTTCQAGYYCVGGTTGRQSCGTNKSSNAGATSASQCFDLWNCATYGGQVKSGLCYKVGAQSSCSGTPVSGHTWRVATVNDVKTLGAGTISFGAASTGCTSYHTKYGACMRYGTVCTVIQYKAAYYVAGSKYAQGYTAPATATSSTSSYCPANKTICVAPN